MLAQYGALITKLGKLVSSQSSDFTGQCHNLLLRNESQGEEDRDGNEASGVPGLAAEKVGARG